MQTQTLFAFQRNTLRHLAIRRPHQALMPILGDYGRLIPAHAVSTLKTMQIWSRMLLWPRTAGSLILQLGGSKNMAASWKLLAFPFQLVSML